MDDLTTEVVKLVFAIVAPVLATLVTALLVRLFKKVGLQLDAERQAKLEKITHDAILRAEEVAATRLRAQLPVTAKDKLETAIADILDRVPGVTADEAAALVHQQLPRVGLGAASFLTRVRQAATN